MARPDDGTAKPAAELARRTEAEGRMAAALVELENHPGHRLLTAGPLDGVTAGRWAAAQAILAALWTDFALYRTALDDARAVAARRSAAADDELRRLLMTPSIEVARTPVALADRAIAGPAEHVETVGLAELAARMDVSFREVSDVITTCDATHRALIAELVPLADRAAAALDLARELDPGHGDPLTAEIAELHRICFRDPLSVAGRPVSEVAAPAVRAVAAMSAWVADLAAVRDGWDAVRAELAAQLAELDTIRKGAEADGARARARELITDAGVEPVPDRVAALRVQLAGLDHATGWPERATASSGLRTATVAATAEMRAARELARGLLDRRTELRGRFQSYQAKAVRLGRSERPDLLALDERLRALLWTKPCDLAGATMALVDYQHLLRGEHS